MLPDKINETLYSQAEKIKKLSKEINLKDVTLIYENFFLNDLENMKTKTYVTKVEEIFSIYGLISFSGKAKKDKPISVISPENKLKFNVEKISIKQI